MAVRTAPSPTDIFRTRARTFSLAARLLPAESREAVTALYLFARTVDDIADELAPRVGAAAATRLLDDWRGWLDATHDCAPDPAVGDALRAVLAKYDVPTQYLQLLLDGVISDLELSQVEDWEELQTYCFRVASSVGLAMCHLFGAHTDLRAMQAAADLGLAMQLTNILRDVDEDLRAGRVYLPATELDEHGYSAERLWGLANARRVDDDFRQLMRHQIARARTHYDRGLAGVRLLPVGAQLPILVAGRLYRAILEEIESADFNVFARRAVVSPRRKAAEIARCWVDLRTATPCPQPEPQPLMQCPEWVSKRYSWHA